MSMNTRTFAKQVVRVAIEQFLLHDEVNGDHDALVFSLQNGDVRVQYADGSCFTISVKRETT